METISMVFSSTMGLRYHAVVEDTNNVNTAKTMTTSLFIFNADKET